MLGRPRGEVAEGETLIFPRAGECAAGVKRRLVRRFQLLVRPPSCPAPSASQLIVCLGNTLVATCVTLIDERLEFK